MKYKLKELNGYILEENRYLVYKEKERFRIFDTKRICWLKIDSGEVVLYLSNGKTKHMASIQKTLKVHLELEKLKNCNKRYIEKVNGIDIYPMRYIAYRTGKILDTKTNTFKSPNSYDTSLVDIQGKLHRIHKSSIIYQTFNPDILVDKTTRIVFKDNNTRNVNIDNLELVTLKDSYEKRKKLNKEIIEELKEVINILSDKDIGLHFAVKYNVYVSRSTIHSIRNGKIYKKEFKDFEFK